MLANFMQTGFIGTKPIIPENAWHPTEHLLSIPEAKEALWGKKEPKVEKKKQKEEESEDSDFEEPTEADLIAMMEAIPMEDAADGWDRDLPIMVIPLDLDSYMECFWGSKAPYYIPALVTGEKNTVVNYSKWKKPSEEAKTVFGNDILGERRIEKHIKNNAIMRMYTAPYVF